MEVEILTGWDPNLKSEIDNHNVRMDISSEHHYEGCFFSSWNNLALFSIKI